MRRDRRAWTATTSTPWKRSSAWPSGARAARRAWSRVQALRGDAVWKAMEAGSWKAGGWDPRLFEACLCRSQTLAQPPTFSHRYPTPAQMREWVKEPVAYRFEYADGLKATMLLHERPGRATSPSPPGSRARSEPLSTLFYLPPNPNVVYSAALMSKAEEMFLTGKAPYPVERTLLTTGLVAAGMQSLADGQKRLETPHLAVKYEVPKRIAVRPVVRKEVIHRLRR